MATKKQKTPPPPFKKGDWITYRVSEYTNSKRFAPKDKEIWQAESTPVFVGKATGSGFSHRDVDSAHFVPATNEDFARVIHDIEQRVFDLAAKRNDLMTELNRRKEKSK